MENYEEFHEGEELSDNFLSEEEVSNHLAAYRSKRLKESLTGPVTSFVFHAILLIFLSFFVVAQPNEYITAIEVSIEEIEIKEIKEKVIEEIKEASEEVTDEAPELEIPEITETVSDSAIEEVSDDVPESDDNMDMEEVLDIIPHNTPLKIAGFYGGRTAAGRTGALRKHGASASGQNAVDKTLKWLAKVQRDNGSWENDPAHSGLALLCFLAHGETPLSEEYGITVQKAMQWLSNGMPEGKAWGRAYSHGIATYAVAESYGMTQIPFLKESMERGIDTIIKGQQNSGGFDYHYKKGPRWDVSVTGWQMQAMKAAYVAGSYNEGLEKAMEKSARFMSQAYSNGKFAYVSGNHGHSNMTGIGTLSLQLFGRQRDKQAQGGLETIEKVRLKRYEEAIDDWTVGTKNLYGWYYDTQAAFQAQGRLWRKWNPVFQEVLITNQHSEGYWRLPESHISGDALGKRILTTTLCCLQLEVYYRYLPTFKISKENFIKVEGIGDANEDAGLIIE